MGGAVFSSSKRKCSEDAMIDREVMVNIKNSPGVLGIKRELW